MTSAERAQNDMMSQAAAWAPRARIFMVIRLLNGRVGGAERLFCDMASLLAEEGYDVTVLYCDSRPEPIFYPISNKVTRINLWGKTARASAWYRFFDRLSAGFPKKRSRMPFDWLAKNLYFTRRLHAAAVSACPDLIISFLPPANTPSLLAGRLAGVKVVPTNHSVPVHDYRSKIRWDQNPIDKRIRLFALRWADRVHVLSPDFVDWFPERIRRKIVAIPNFVAPEFIGLEPQGPREKVILAVGRLADIKNYPVLVEAWSLISDKHPDWSVKIYGNGPHRRKLRADIAERGLEDSVHLMGHESDMRGPYLSAEIFCHPALFEGFGLAAAEALACGLPVVAFSDCAGVTGFVKDGENGLLADRDGGAVALASALERLIGDDDLREALRRRAILSVASLSKEAFSNRWVTLVDEVTGNVPDTAAP